MKAAVFYGEKDLRIENLPIPEPGPGELLVKVHACGVCGTDVHIYHGDEGAAKSPPRTVLGHEFAGEVAAVGTGVTAAKVGDRVCVDPNKLCGQCHFCKSGAGHFCEEMIGIGTTVNGGFAEYCLVPESQVLTFGPELSYEKAAMTEPVACCLHGIDLCNIQCGSTVAVIGCGMIGLLMLQLAKLRGAARLVAIEPVAIKRQQALDLGADLVLDPTAGDVGAALAQAGYTQIDTVIECVGKVSTIELAIHIAGKYSTVMMFGLTEPNEEIRIKPFTIFKKEIVLKASFINPYTFPRALALIQSGKIDVNSMVCKVAPPEELVEILTDPALRAKGKYLISCL